MNQFLEKHKPTQLTPYEVGHLNSTIQENNTINEIHYLPIRMGKIKSKGAQKSDHSYIMGRLQNGKATLENSLIISLRTKHATALQPSNCPPGCKCQRNFIFTQKYVH